MAATIRIHHRRAPMLPINTGSWSRAQTCDRSRPSLPDSGGWPICGSEKMESKSYQLWGHDNFSSSVWLISHWQNRFHFCELSWYRNKQLYFLDVSFCLLMKNPWGSLSIPTPALLTAAIVSQYCFPGVREEISRLFWPLSTVQFWYWCSSDSTHHTWVEKQFVSLR